MSKLEVDYREKIISYMKLKQVALDLSDISSPRYFTLIDSKYILKWDKEAAKEIFFHMSNYVVAGSMQSAVHCCPFCVKYLRAGGALMCWKCEYGEKHGECNERGSDFHILTDECSEHGYAGVNGLVENSLVYHRIEKLFESVEEKEISKKEMTLNFFKKKIKTRLKGQLTGTKLLSILYDDFPGIRRAMKDEAEDVPF